MDKVRFYRVLDIESPEEFQYYENLASLLEEDEFIEENLIKDLLKDWDDGFKEFKGVERMENEIANLADDSITRKLLEGFIECEAEHRAWVAQHMGIIKRIGYENYLTLQLGD